MRLFHFREIIFKQIEDWSSLLSTGLPKGAVPHALFTALRNQANG
jgi:hypothetical protein